MKLSQAGFSLLALASSAMTIESRSVHSLTADFDNIPNGFTIATPYKNLAWQGFLVSSPDRGQSSYVKYDSPFQYARIYNGTQLSIERTSAVSSFLVTELKYACSVPTDNLINPGPPTSCTIKMEENCLQSGKSRTLTLSYNPTTAIAPMKELNVSKGQKCTKGKSYSFQSNGPDILLDGVQLREVLKSRV